jgi:hypothetical protein
MKWKEYKKEAQKAEVLCSLDRARRIEQTKSRALEKCKESGTPAKSISLNKEEEQIQGGAIGQEELTEECPIGH